LLNLIFLTFVLGCVAKLQHWAGGPGFRAVHSPPAEKMHDAIRVVILKIVRGANPTDPVPYLALNHATVTVFNLWLTDFTVPPSRLG